MLAGLFCCWELCSRWLNHKPILGLRGYPRELQ